MDINKKIAEHLSTFVTPARLNLFERILDWRTNYITIVLEDIYQSQNASAVLRTCDCFGIQNVHVIENRNTFNVNREVSLGASKWLTLNKYGNKKNNTQDVIKNLRKAGYRIVATTPHKNDQLLSDFDITKGKIALVFGSELPGISKTVLREADEYIKIPMFGFTESFNISVSASIILHHLTEKLRKKPAELWKLSNLEKSEIRLQWLRNTIKKSDLLEKEFIRKYRSTKV